MELDPLEILMKGDPRGGKYTGRVATGDPKRPYRYVYGKPDQQKTGKHVHLSPDALQHKLKSGHFSIVSAGRNPAHPAEKDLPADHPKFKERHEQLRGDLEAHGLDYTEVEGHYGGKEPSFVVHHHPDVKPTNNGRSAFMVHHDGEGDGRSEHEVVRGLARKYNQDSVVHYKAGTGELHYTVGEHAGQHHKGSGFEYKPEADDFYTKVDHGGKKPSKFTLNFDWDHLHDHSAAVHKSGDTMRTDADPLAILKGMVPLDTLQKAEGSRGGHVIGHTSTGKPVYAPTHPTHAGPGGTPIVGVGQYKALESFTTKDHKDAAKLHQRAASQISGKAGGTVRQGREYDAHVEAADAHTAASNYRPYKPGQMMRRSEDSNREEEADFDVVKGAGEGSRGGRVIGHTRSGKPIYADGKGVEGYSRRDHADASQVHGQEAEDLHKLGGTAGGGEKAAHHEKLETHHFDAAEDGLKPENGGAGSHDAGTGKTRAAAKEKKGPKIRTTIHPNIGKPVHHDEHATVLGKTPSGKDVYGPTPALHTIEDHTKNYFSGSANSSNKYKAHYKIALAHKGFTADDHWEAAKLNDAAAKDAPTKQAKAAHETQSRIHRDFAVKPELKEQLAAVLKKSDAGELQDLAPSTDPLDLLKSGQGPNVLHLGSLRYERELTALTPSDRDTAPRFPLRRDQ